MIKTLINILELQKHFNLAETDTGSDIVQIGFLTNKMHKIQQHLSNNNKKDKHSKCVLNVLSNLRKKKLNQLNINNKNQILNFIKISKNINN